MPSRSRNSSVKVSVVGASVMVAGQLHHGGRCGFRNGVVGPPSPVPVSHCGGTVPAVSRQQTLGVAFTYSHNFGSLSDGQLVFQNTVEHLNPGLFLLIQCQFPHGMTFSLTS